MKKLVKISLTLALIIACLSQTTLGVFAASSKNEYVSEVILSYGETPDEAKKWLTDNGYQYVDSNLNEGADDTIFLSEARAVYLGYKTTNDPEKAITDMKLMNMSGGYSVQDYQIILNEKKTDIQQFISQFIAALAEYRENYSNNSPRAESAYLQLNMMVDDDTGYTLGDLFLNKIKEEIPAEEYEAMSAEEKKQHADMTTILMQGNAELVLTIEQILSTATDTNETLWLDRLAETPDYDTMLETVMAEENVDPSKAESILAARYDNDAKIIAGYAEGYRDWLKDYTEADARFTDNEEKIASYLESLDEEQKYAWYTEGAQYEILNGLEYDEDTTLLDLFLSDDLDITGKDIYLIYPIVATLTEGQRACLDFLYGYQFFAMGYNTDKVVESTIKSGLFSDDVTISVFAGVDRSIYSEEVALTGDAYRMQTSDNKDYSTNWFEDGISDTTKTLGIITGSVIAVTIGAFVTNEVLNSKSNDLWEKVDLIAAEHDETNYVPTKTKLYNQYRQQRQLAWKYTDWAKIFYYATLTMTVVSIILTGVTLWKSYKDLKAYYHTDFTPIPMWMVDQGVDENDAKTFTYYKATYCNRKEGNFTADNTVNLKNFGDLNGDIGKQWLALYTTTDKAAGKPIVADFKVQTGNANVPGNYTALSLFGSQSAQNLTDKKSGFTYNDELGGIYLFYNTNSGIFAASAITTGTWAAIAGGIAVLGLGIFLVVRHKKKS